ncbi:MAG TPA: penicillin acylase family protein [Solirubrobacteraceae bacterium]|nr:penicillin acylase family protein [Solirubrobacteraceae bacterium]
MGSHGSWKAAAAALALPLALTLSAAAAAGVRSAESVLPPGQSGFVPPEGQPDNPHLTDQVSLFESFAFKPAGFDQPGQVESPRAGVTITRDAYGVPNVRAGTPDDAWFGVGYAVAQDRLVELELFRRSTQGRLAEVLGKDRLESDIVARRDYYTRKELQAQLSKLPAALRARFDAYADGVNAWMARVAADPSLRPREFALLGLVPKPWTVLDSASIGVQLARTVPSDDGRELDNWRALGALGAKPFARYLPVHQIRPVTTVPASVGKFPSQPGRSRTDEKKGYKASQKFLKGIKPPSASAAVAHVAGRLPARGGSFHFALRGAGNTASLFSAPQLGFSIPELFVEYEVHAPGLDARGVTGPGIPVVAAGHNGRIAWGITSGLDDDDDLYVEKLAGKERYRFKGRTRKMSCRNETFKVAGAKSVKRRFCRTVHGPVQQTKGNRAYARRYAIWGREMQTFIGLAALNDATSVRQADSAAAKLTWNENLLVADDGGHIGWWHPGLLPLRPKRWDERLPFPGTGEAEWRGLLSVKQRPKVIDPPQGYLGNWNNTPSVGWTNGDASAQETNEGDLHRGAFLQQALRETTDRSLAGLKAIERRIGTTAQQRSLLASRLQDAQAAASGPARTVLDTIVAWDGNYDREDANGTVDPGVAAFEALKTAVKGTLPKAAVTLLGERGGSHPFDMGAAEAAGFHASTTAGLVRAAATAQKALAKRFGSADPAAWREPRKLYKVQVQGVASAPRLKFYDRGTFSQAVEVGP